MNAACQRCSLFAASPGFVGLALLDVDVIGEDVLAAEHAVQSFGELPRGMKYCDTTIAPAALVTRTRGLGWAISSTIASAISPGSAFRNPLAPWVPEMSSVLTNVGNTIENFTPAVRYSSRAESVNATTACLLAQ